MSIVKPKLEKTLRIARPRPKAEALQFFMHAPNYGQIKKSAMLKRDGSTHWDGGLYKKLQIPTLPPKSPRSGVTFHLRIVYRNQIF